MVLIVMFAPPVRELIATILRTSVFANPPVNVMVKGPPFAPLTITFPASAGIEFKRKPGPVRRWIQSADGGRELALINKRKKCRQSRAGKIVIC